MHVVPAVFKCREHDHELTEDVVAKVTATPTKVAGGAFRPGARRAPRAFRVIVHCPEGAGHDLVFSGTYET
jgi:hypothetical protein